jgi:hypothetical protein
MGTRCTVAIAEGESVRFITVNWDGYLTGVGRMLLNNFNDIESVNRLIDMGDASSINETIDDSIFYARDRNESWDDASPIQMPVASYFEDVPSQWEFNYLFLEGQWFVVQSKTDVKPLKNLL